MSHLGKDIGVVVASDEVELVGYLDRLEELQSPTEGRRQEHVRLLDFLRRAIESEG